MKSKYTCSNCRGSGHSRRTCREGAKPVKVARTTVSTTEQLELVHIVVISAAWKIAPGPIVHSLAEGAPETWRVHLIDSLIQGVRTAIEIGAQHVVICMDEGADKSVLIPLAARLRATLNGVQIIGVFKSAYTHSARGGEEVTDLDLDWVIRPDAAAQMLADKITRWAPRRRDSDLDWKPWMPPIARLENN